MSLLLHAGRQLTASFHAELYHLVPENHLLQKIHPLVDFSFIHELVENSYCKCYGRLVNEPELLFRLLFLQILYNLSDERVIQEAQANGITVTDVICPAGQHSTRKALQGSKQV